MYKQAQLFECEDNTSPHDHIQNTHNTTFIDLCAGIGGGRLGLEKAGFKCVSYAEINKKSIETYNTMHKTDHSNMGDLTCINCENIPDTDLLIAGFPCQTFSIVGKRKGFADERGKIIFSIVNILKTKKIKYFILENVEGLINLDNGKVLQDVINLLSKANYNIHYKVLNSENYGVPQQRKRVYFVGILKSLKHNKYTFPLGQDYTYNLNDYLTNTDKKYEIHTDSSRFQTLLRYLGNKYNNNNISIENLMKYENTIIDTRQSDLRLYKNKSPTLRAGRHGLLYVKNGVLRSLSGAEALLLQGFPQEYANKTTNINNQALLTQAGNGMTVNVIYALATNLINTINKNKG